MAELSGIQITGHPHSGDGTQAENNNNSNNNLIIQFICIGPFYTQNDPPAEAGHRP